MLNQDPGQSPDLSATWLKSAADLIKTNKGISNITAEFDSDYKSRRMGRQKGEKVIEIDLQHLQKPLPVAALRVATQVSTVDNGE